MDYYNSMLPQNQPPVMPSMHQYSQMAQTEIGQDLWDHEKHVSIFKAHLTELHCDKIHNYCLFICSYFFLISESRMVKMD